eukprot:768057-Hanusia_phi.AAC.3
MTVLMPHSCCRRIIPPANTCHPSKGGDDERRERQRGAEQGSRGRRGGEEGDEVRGCRAGSKGGTRTERLVAPGIASRSEGYFPTHLATVRATWYRRLSSWRQVAPPPRRQTARPPSPACQPLPLQPHGAFREEQEGEGGKQQRADRPNQRHLPPPHCEPERVAEQDSEGAGELVEGAQEAAQPPGRDLGDVHGGRDRRNTCCKPRDQPAHEEHRVAATAHEDSGEAQEEEQGSDQNDWLPPQRFYPLAAGQSSDDSSDVDDGGKGRTLKRGERVVACQGFKARARVS